MTLAAGTMLLLGAVSGPHDLLRAGASTLGAAILIIGVLLWAGRSRRLNRQGRPHWSRDPVAGLDSALTALMRPSALGALGYLGFDIAVLWTTFAAGPPPRATAVARHGA